MELNFDEIRPFEDREVQDALQRLSLEPGFDEALAYVFPELGSDELRKLLSSIQTVDDFQTKIVAGAVERISDFTTSGLEISGLEQLNPGQPYLFISNHRDIVLDSAFINYILHREGFPTTRIAIGNNLLQKSWITDLVKLNKNFIVHRNVASRMAYDYSLRLSSYIKHSLEVDRSSVWIAQREGRTKDGIDKTQPGLLKMFTMAHNVEPSEAFVNMHLVPITMSYEKEPCAALKAKELYYRAVHGAYTKQVGEDLNSMKIGISSPKGKVHIHFGEEIQPIRIAEFFEGYSKNDGFKNMAEAIDEVILSGFKLSPSNFIAADLLKGTANWEARYSSHQKDRFIREMDKELAQIGDENPELIKPFYLEIYANPLLNKEKLNLSVN
jgi:1-acyl-sn-glycerol-3-phosphate acyltransferase